MKYVKLMADYASSGVWESDGLMMDSDDLPISNRIKEMIFRWMCWYEESQFFLPPEERTVDFDIQNFSKIGEQIAKEIKLELSDWTVVYMNEEYMNMFDLEKDRDIYEYEIVL